MCFVAISECIAWPINLTRQVQYDGTVVDRHSTAKTSYNNNNILALSGKGGAHVNMLWCIAEFG